MESGASLVELAAWIVFGGILLLTASLGIVLAYHWFRYAMSPAATAIALSAYVTVCGLLCFGMFGALLALRSAL